ncbi:CesT family type III secretion system chaperone [Chitinimonas sp. PSY-7]|uniref:CesT family type III secretion system chaperone n=1 Tax=Chitinimonas sp. PSY-7 TaxID=3459088 RepID=UPI0040401B2B
MENLLLSLYDTLGLELDAEEPVLWVEEDLAVYFEETPLGLEMICPLGALPNEVAKLQQLLQHNYASPIVLAADADNSLLLALLRTTDESSGTDLLAKLELLISSAHELRKMLGLSGPQQTTPSEHYTALRNEFKNKPGLAGMLA